MSVMKIRQALQPVLQKHSLGSIVEQLTMLAQGRAEDASTGKAERAWLKAADALEKATNVVMAAEEDSV